MQRHDTGIFAEPVDHVPMLFALVFLNLPLQMVLGLSALMLHESKRPRAKIMGWVLGVLATVMIAVNFACGIWYAFA